MAFEALYEAITGVTSLAMIAERRRQSDRGSLTKASSTMNELLTHCNL